jgi:acetyltransferase AlgX (SGNH hydrolase-like protein)
VAVFALIMALEFGVFEAALRTWGSSEAAPAFQGLFTNDPVIGYRLKPGARVRFATTEFDTEIAINAAGVRDDEEIGPKASDERRVLILGDSLVLSVQVPFRQTFGELLEQRLNASSKGIRYRVINGGVQGYGPVQELLFFRSILPVVQPDVVVETLFVGNDAEEALSAEALLGPPRPAWEVFREAATTRRRRFVRRSMILQVLRLRLVTATQRFTRTAGPPEPPLQVYAAHPAPRIARGLAVTRQVVEAMAADGAAAGARTAVMLMPARFQVDDGDYGRLRDGIARAGGDLVRDAATERFASTLEGLRVPRFDALPALRSALPGPDVFFQQTVHLTPRGHEIVAGALERFLRESGLLDERPMQPAGR